MTQAVAVEEKKAFIRWFLKQHEMKRRECVWILSYLKDKDDLLQKLHFVEEAHYCPKAMVMTVKQLDGVPFRFYKGTLMTADAEKTFHDIRLNPNEDVYLQINFPGNPPEYLAVLEENEFMPKYLSINEKDVKFADEVVEHLMKMQMEQTFEQMINEALDTGDKERFLELTKAQVIV